MKTRNRDAGTPSGLPAPPAPTARDANPWPIAPAPSRRAQALRPVKPAAAPAATHSPKQAAGSLARMRRPPLFAFVVLGVIGVIALTGAVRALESGHYLDAVGPLLTVAFAVFVSLRILRRRR